MLDEQRAMDMGQRGIGMDVKDAEEMLRPSVASQRVRPGSMEEAEALDQIDQQREGEERAERRGRRRRGRGFGIPHDDGGYR